MLGLGLSIPQVAARGSRSLVAAIRSLFAANEPGVWYDPSDLSTLFQDAAGSTPVTAVEQPVGLMLDKSKGLALGPELVTNGTFNTDINGWNSSGATVSRDTSYFPDGSIRLSFDVTYSQVLYSLPLLTVGKWYQLSGIAINPTSLYGSLDIINAGIGAAYISEINKKQVLTITFLCTSANGSVRLCARRSTGEWGSSGAIYADNISVREIPGNHAYQTTATSRPVLSARYNLLTKTEQFDDAVWAKNGATVTANTTATIDPLGGNTADLLYPSSTGSNRIIYQVLSVNAVLTRKVYVKAAGKSVFYVDLTGGGTQHAFFDLSNGTVGSVQSGYTASIESVGNGWYKCSVSNATAISYSFGGVYGVADANGSTAVTANGTDGIYIWGASLVPADQAHLPYQRVNTATDYDADPAKFPHYLRFDGVDDWLVTNTITPGIDKAQVFAGVRKLSDASAGCVVELSSGYLVNSGTFTCFAPGSNFPTGYDCPYRGTAMVITPGFAAAAPITNVISSAYNIAAPSAVIRSNGAQVSSSTTGAGTGNFGNYPLYIGSRGGTSYPFNGHLYSLIVRFGSNLPAATIEKTENYINTKTRAY